MESNYLESIRKQFAYYKLLGDQVIERVPESRIFAQYNETSNSIAIIVQHLAGNMLSRWTDFLHSDGEKPWRNRDLEFEPVVQTKTELIHIWEEGWNCFLSTLHKLGPEDLSKIIHIRNEGHTVLEAINRQLAHYPYHIGQMVYIGKMICGQDWESLSIPKGKSDTYNATHFSKPKHRGHYTDETLQKPEDQ